MPFSRSLPQSVVDGGLHGRVEPAEVDGVEVVAVDGEAGGGGALG